MSGDIVMPQLLARVVMVIVNLLCMIGGFGFMVYSLFMTPEYAGEQHNMLIVGILLVVIGGQK